MIVTIIVIIILAAVVILTISKNNPIESSKEAAFKEDVRTIQDELAMYIAKDYTNKAGQRDNKINADKYTTDGATDSVYTYIPSFSKKYEGKFAIKNDELVYKEDNLTENEIKLVNSLNIRNSKNPVPEEWTKYIGEVTDDGVPIPKGFTYLTGTKATGLVIEDNSHNEFVWIPVANGEYKKDFDFKSNFSASKDNTSDPAILSNLDETADVNLYHGFYIGRYEATVADETSNGKPTCKKECTVWTNLTQSESVANAESMYRGNDLSIQSGLLTGTAWDRTCHWISDYQITIDEGTENERKETIDINNSVKYGNYKNAEDPANKDTYTSGQKQLSGKNENWKIKNIYDLAGNVIEWTYEAYANYRVSRGGYYGGNGTDVPASYRHCNYSPAGRYDGSGFRVRLYIKTN